MIILGQDKLLAKIDSYTIRTFPRSVILLGEAGSGKHLLSSYIAERFNLEQFDITEQLTQEFINSLSARVNTTLYLIDSSFITERHQNMLLKFIEEPPTNAFIVILAETRVSLLPTIINRCSVLEIAQYTKDILEQFIDADVDRELALSIANTPGQLKLLKMTNLSEMKNLCLKMTEKLVVASYPNTLSISDKLNYKDEFDKYDVSLFFNMLLHVLFTSYKEINNPETLSLYLETNDYVTKMVDKRLNRKHLVENYLSTIWQKARTA